MSTHIAHGPRGRRFLYELITSSGEKDGMLTDALFLHANEAEGVATFGWAQETVLDTGNRGTDSDGMAGAEKRSATAAESAANIASITLNPTPEQVSDALADAVVWAAYWQEPDVIDISLARPEIVAALADIDDNALLAFLSSSENSSRIDTPGDLSVAWMGLDEDPRPVADVLNESHERLLRSVERSKRDKPDDPAAAWSGMWWSMPPSELRSSMGMTRSGIPEALHYVEDGPPREEAVISRLKVSADRLYVIDSPDDWAALCEKYPIDVTAEVRQDWYRVTGRDGCWVIPNWLDVAGAWDGVLLTKRAYLSSAGTAIPVGDAASVIAGWNPGETYWLTDAVEVLESWRWKRDGDGDWVLDMD